MVLTIKRTGGIRDCSKDLAEPVREHQHEETSFCKIKRRQLGYLAIFKEIKFVCRCTMISTIISQPDIAPCHALNTVRDISQ